MHRRVTDTENLQKLKASLTRQVAMRTSALAHESDIFVVVISVQEAMNID